MNDFEARVRDSFAKQQVMNLLGASVERVAPGEVDLAFGYRDDLTQQHGFLHAGIVATVLDSACGYAAFSLMPAEAGVLTIEYKINLMAPAKGESFIARARVKRPGRTITVVGGDAYAVERGVEKPIATMVATVMCVVGRDDVTG